MSKKIKTILFTLISFAVAGNATAQDLHFSQFFNAPLLTNPANTGFIPDADYRFGGSYRSQWNSIIASPYKTYTFFADAQVFRDRLENGWLGLGGVMLADVAGTGNLKSTKIYGSVAYHQMLGNSSLVSAGFNVGWASKRIDATNLKFPAQFNGKFFDASLPSGVIFSNTSVNYLDIQAGMNYAYFPQENVYINAGYSIQHVNKPKETFFNDNANDNTIAMRHIGFVNAILKVHDRVIVNPNVYFTMQAKSMELVGGATANFNLSEFGEKQLIGGVYYRLHDAVIPVVGLETGNLKLTFSYDATMSNLNQYNGYKGGFEISLIKKGFYPETQDRQSFCPSFANF
jgi:type IX secretion system PorP/SprF family membrane protein